MNATEQTYQRGWDRAFAKQAADLAVKQAAARRLEAAAECGARDAVEAKQPGDLLTVREAAARLHVTDRTVRNLMAAGKLATIRIPGTTARRVEPDAVDALIEEGREVRK